MNNFKNTITITFGCLAENSHTMQKIGTMSESGFNYEDLISCYYKFKQLDENVKLELYNLNQMLPEELPFGVVKPEDAYVLIIRNGLDILLSKRDRTIEELWNEQNSLKTDSKEFAKGIVRNKLKRHNLCFSNYSQVADYENGKGTIIDFKDVPLTSYVHDWLPLLMGEKGNNLQGEGNYYYDVNKTMIGNHGDAERKKVIAFHLVS
jgi:hypothetical protein